MTSVEGPIIAQTGERSVGSNVRASSMPKHAARVTRNPRHDVQTCEVRLQVTPCDSIRGIPGRRDPRLISMRLDMQDRPTMVGSTVVFDRDERLEELLTARHYEEG